MNSRNDVLSLTLKTLRVDEEVIVTHRAFRSIQDRMNAFFNTNHYKRFVVMTWNGVKKIKRTA